MYRPRLDPQNDASHRLGYLPGLDGLRALAVMAVLVFHADPSWLPGGYLGVEVFFVLSGFLITTLLLREWGSAGTISPGAFWGRRARRLLPALFVLLVATLSYALLFEADEVVRLREDTLAALAYATNWYLIFGEQPYFATVERPSLLQHLWSLAVEEQFYLLWPLAFVALMRAGGVRLAFVATAGGALGSWLLGAWLWDAAGDSSRVYYGSDTRAGGLLAGAALAFALSSARWGTGHRRSWDIDMLGAGAIGALGLMAWRIEGTSPFLHRGGLTLTAALTAVVLFAMVHPRAHLLNRAMEAPVLRWLGTRSYGIYLWHWPIFMVTRPGQDIELGGTQLFALRLALTLAAAAASYRLIEEPIRLGAAAKWLRGFRQGGKPRAFLAAGGAYSAAVLFFAASAGGPAIPDYLQDGRSVHVVVTPEPSPAATPTPAPTNTPLAEPTPSHALETPTGTPAIPVRAEHTPPPTPAITGDILALGDSVMLASAASMGTVGRVEVDAAVGRLPWQVPGLLRARQEAGTLPSTVVIHTGNNGVISRQTLDELMDTLSGVERVVLVNVRVKRDWEQGNNATIADAPSRYANVRVVDWYGATAGRDDLFASDGIHPGAAGAALYAELIAAAVAGS
ncbi:MAG: acetyltransferase [Dehalococcoidia bacterium]|nr:acetyltransferase [Dehalococcoidia bacterium]